MSSNGISMVSDTGPFTTFTLDIGRTGVGPRGPEAPDTNIGPTLDQNSCTVRVISISIKLISTVMIVNKILKTRIQQG